MMLKGYHFLLDTHSLGLGCWGVRSHLNVTVLRGRRIPTVATRHLPLKRGEILWVICFAWVRASIRSASVRARVQTPQEGSSTMRRIFPPLRSWRRSRELHSPPNHRILALIRSIFCMSGPVGAALLRGERNEWQDVIDGYFVL